MLIMTTPRHATRICIGGIRGDVSYDGAGFARAVDDAIDRLYASSRDDKELLDKITEAPTRDAANRVLLTRLSQDKDLSTSLKKEVGRDICRRVLYLLMPDRFGFERFGWIH